MDTELLYVTLGILFLFGLAADSIGRATHLPRVTMLLLLGLLAGKAGLDVIPSTVAAWFDDLSVLALTMVAFLLGGALTRKTLTEHGVAIIVISLSIVLVTLAVVTLGLLAFGTPIELSLLLAAIATATAPAAMTDVIRNSGVSNGFTHTLNGIVAIDDAWGLIVFSVALALVGQGGAGGEGGLATAAWDLGGALLLGAAIGGPAAFLTGRLKPGEPMQAEAIGLVFLTAGLALWLEVSFLVAGMTAGGIIANFARHHERAFHEIEHIQWPFIILFFLLAGATLEVDALVAMGWIGALFILLRGAARLVGGYVGARLSGGTRREAAWFGPALLPQAGVSVGMALVAAEHLPDWAGLIMAVTISSTVVFEIIGPPLTLLAIRRADGSPDR